MTWFSKKCDLYFRPSTFDVDFCRHVNTGGFWTSTHRLIDSPKARLQDFGVSTKFTLPSCFGMGLQQRKCKQSPWPMSVWTNRRLEMLQTKVEESWEGLRDLKRTPRNLTEDQLRNLCSTFCLKLINVPMGSQPQIAVQHRHHQGFRGAQHHGGAVD